MVRRSSVELIECCLSSLRRESATRQGNSSNKAKWLGEEPVNFLLLAYISHNQAF